MKKVGYPSSEILIDDIIGVIITIKTSASMHEDDGRDIVIS